MISLLAKLVSQTSAVVPDLAQFANLSLSSIVATEHNAYTFLSNANVAKASGYDGIGNKILKLSKEGLHKPLTRLINLSLTLGQYPSCWEMANVLPLFKKDNRQVKSNYRPVSLLPCISKLCEKIVFIELYKFLEKSNFFYRYQSGFRPGDSTVMQLTYIVQKIYNDIEEGHEVRVLFLDISKAFDKVWHIGLLAKLKSVGIRGSLYNWFGSYLIDRYQRVTIQGVNSNWGKIEAGVPQGSVLGPLLFLIYINDLPQGISSDCFLFADDSFLLEKITSPSDSAQKLNYDLRSNSTWANQWLVTRNTTKLRA